MPGFHGIRQPTPAMCANCGPSNLVFRRDIPLMGPAIYSLHCEKCGQKTRGCNDVIQVLQVWDGIQKEIIESRGTDRDNKAIIVWRFQDAPEYLQKLSRHGGDEDWIIVIPTGMDVPFWAETDSGVLGDYCNSEHKLPDGRTIVIAAHS